MGLPRSKVLTSDERVVQNEGRVEPVDCFRTNWWGASVYINKEYGWGGGGFALAQGLSERQMISRKIPYPKNNSIIIKYE